MSTTHDPTRTRPLRLWPGVVAVLLLWAARFGIKVIVGGFQGFAFGLGGAFVGALLVIAWWLFLSRVPRVERWGGLALVIVALAVTFALNDPSMGPFWLATFGVPVLCTALVVAAFASARLSERWRRATITVAIVGSAGVWTLFRMDGISGDHVPDFTWRWAARAEASVVALDPVMPATAGPPSDFARTLDTDPLTVAASVSTVATLNEPEAARPDVSPRAPVVRSSNPAPAFDWPGFRGPDRASVVRGVRLASDWDEHPPIEIWRRKVGPGWSSFAVRGDVFYTQEQRGEDEIVAAYRVSTGEPVWLHKDTARFYEANAGAGPRATPTLSGDHVYAFGATGILNVLDARTGRVVWSRDVAKDTGTATPIWGFAASPIVTDGLVVVAASARLAAYDAATGARRWLGPDGGGESYSSPQLATIDGVAQVLLMTPIGATSVALADGAPLWSHAWPAFVGTIVQPMPLAGGDVLISRVDIGTRRIGVRRQGGQWTVTERWMSNTLKPYFNDFVIHNGHAYGFDGRILASVSLADGSRAWKNGRYGNGQVLLLADQDLLIVTTEEGEIALVDALPERFNERARFKAIEGKTWNHPVLVGDILLVRNGEEMAAFKLP